ncbi:MAG: catechol 1,2-dioxygenase [Pseudonocardiales bacterium]|jgi:catechol 1,2-dioxygenase|nr:catechol 1,2-dioxygenase [Pseudonocardiales bacterium]
MSNQRLLEVVEDIERTMLELIRKHQVTHEEYRAATDLLIASINGGEESLLLDVFFEAEAADVANIGRVGSPVAIEGPFYLAGAPALRPPYVLPQRPDERGEPLIFRGTVSSTDGAPLAGAELDIWHADAEGLYSQIHPGIPDWNLRGRLQTSEDGSFEVRTILPPPYEIPKHGPTGRVLSGLGRHFFRPAHVHLKVRAPGREVLTSQLYFARGEYLDNDVANAVRDGLVLEVERDDAAWHATYDFVLEAGRQAVPA